MAPGIPQGDTQEGGRHGPGYEDVEVARDPVRAHENKVKDAWGCLWHYPWDYLDGQVVEHPLGDWSFWNTYRRAPERPTHKSH
ncbi:MAG TPA: hypothetical protein EYP17_02955 [Candidatus Latescibacteria bacterium]|nr:hypothetical protein [Candidatus Latescibacterota bacterium]